METSTFKIASVEEIKESYENLIVSSFPENEVKPLKSILRMHEQGHYFILLYCLEEKIVGAAYVTGYPGGDSFLLDYLVVDKHMQSRGIGISLIRAVAEKYVDGKPLIIETETLESAINEEQIKKRIRRNAFYEKAGARKSDLITNIFGAEYNIWQINGENVDLVSELQNIYHFMVPEKWYDKEVHIPQTEIQMRKN